MSTSEKWTRGLFWFAFGAFLATSVPHVAYIFRYFEPKGDGFDSAWWAVSYGVAIGIDLLICWLSYTRGAQQSSKGDSAVTWVFIALLAALSWYCNWLFAEIMTGVNVWTFVVYQGWTVGSITPLIVSAIPVFMLAYTYMSRTILGQKSPAKSAQELQAEADELRAKFEAKQQIAALKNASLSSWISGKKEVARQAFSRVQTPQLSSENPAKVGDEAGEKLEERPVQSEENSGEQTPVEVPAFEEESVENEEGLHLVGAASQASSSRKYLMTYEEAAEYTGYGIPYLKAQVTAGKIGLGQSGKLKVSDLRIRSGQTGKIPAIRKEQSA